MDLPDHRDHRRARLLSGLDDSSPLDLEAARWAVGAAAGLRWAVVVFDRAGDDPPERGHRDGRRRGRVRRGRGGRSGHRHLAALGQPHRPGPAGPAGRRRGAGALPPCLGLARRRAGAGGVPGAAGGPPAKMALPAAVDHAAGGAGAWGGGALDRAAGVAVCRGHARSAGGGLCPPGCAGGSPRGAGLEVGPLRAGGVAIRHCLGRLARCWRWAR